MGLVLGQIWMVVPINGCMLFCPPIIMYCEVCCCLGTHSVVNVLVMGLVLGQSLMFISTTGILLYYVSFIMYNGSALFLFTQTTLFANIGTHECTFGHQNLGVCEISYTYLLGIERNM